MDNLDVKMEFETENYTCGDIIVEEKFIPDHDPTELELEVNNSEYILNNIENDDDNDNMTTSYNGSEENFSSKKAKSQFLSNGKQLYKCQECKRMYHSLWKFKGHEKLCQKSEKSQISVKRSSSSNDGLFICQVDDCTSKFETKQNLAVHKCDVHTTRKFACLYCDLSFKKKSHKTRHETRKHSKTLLETHQGSKKVIKLKKLQESAEIKVKTESEVEKFEIKQEMKRSKGKAKEPGRLIKSQNRAKMVKKLKKSPESEVKIKSEVVEKVEIKQEFTEGVRVTRRRNKNINFTSFFGLEKAKIPAQNSSESESDGDTSTTVSLDEEGEDNDYETPRVSKISKFNKLKQIDHEKSDEYVCSVCYESFTTKMNAKNHEKNCKDVRKPKVKDLLDLEIHCEYENCSYISSSCANYNLHIDSVHKKLYKHYDKNERDNRTCFLCRKNFKLKAQLEEHLKIPHKIKCPQCAMIFVENAQLARHKTLVHLEELKKFECSKCFKKFLNQIDIKNHTRRFHERKTVLCPICSDEVHTIILSKHSKTHQVDGAKKSFCQVCQVYLTNKTKLSYHLKTIVHLEKLSEKKEYILPHDHDINTINSNRSLLTVKDKSESDEGIFDPAKSTKKSRKAVCICHDCGLRFKNFYNREAHREKYHGYKQPETTCTICDMKFTRKSSLKLHIDNSRTHKLKEKELQTNQKK